MLLRLQDKTAPSSLVNWKMSTHDDDENINFKKLEKELYSAVEADAKYWQENDAKFRAVHQKVATYEEFRDIVLASHLKPLEKGDRISEMGKFTQPWNPHASKKDSLEMKETPGEIDQSSSLPKTSQEFFRDWRRYQKSTKSQYAFLLKNGGLHLNKIFKSEIGFGLLGDMLVSMDTEFMDDDAEQILGILENLSQTNRFSLSVQFLSGKEKMACSHLFEKLNKWMTDLVDERHSKYEKVLDRLCKDFQVKK
ncbi:hypothetical protein ACJMK2_013933 [Sinanodonta woodiana]|uniref:Coiled-coil domain-containing protein 103 n=1 Tax=Sinanodonta woodiana TaxID=1069815 RepID=A0ABD3UZ21_SINWO